MEDNSSKHCFQWIGKLAEADTHSPQQDSPRNNTLDQQPEDTQYTP